MKKEEFERLKAVCEKEGFELEISSPWDQTYKISKKDIWKGIEFAESLKTGILITEGKIYKILKNRGRSIDIYSDKGKFEENMSITLFKPSTEEAYVEQLKKEALERFPNIKEGDIIKTDWTINNLKISKGVSGFCYIKYGDMLLYNTTAIYKEGKWAERVKERVKVTYSGASCKPHPIRNDMDLHEVRFYVNRTNGLPTSNAFDFLASQLEKYLNGEIE